MGARILSCEGNSLPEELANVVIEHQDKALASKTYFEVAISGGSLAKTMAKGLVGKPNVSWKRWRVWLADERIVPLDHEDSNYAVFMKDCVSKLPEDERPVVETLNPTLLQHSAGISSAKFAEDYEHRLVETLGPQPSLDFVFLGMGPDGHTCSLFPEHKLLAESSSFVAGIDDSPKPPPRRITLTKPALKLAKQIVFVATGAAKKDAIHRVFAENDSSLPSEQVNELSESLVLWFVDPPALGH